MSNFLSSLFSGKKKLFWALGSVGLLVVVGAAILFYAPFSPFASNKKDSESIIDNNGGKTEPESGSPTYTNDQTDTSFNYPSDWEIKQEYFYETAAGEKATIPTIILGRKTDPDNATSNQISINLRQASCMGVGSVGYEMAGSTKISIYTQSGSTQKCAEATTDGKDKNGKVAPYTFVSFFDDETVKDVFIEIVKSFKIED